jgi:exosortase
MLPVSDTAGPIAPTRARSATARVDLCLASLALLGALVFAYWQPLVAMVHLWNNSPMYSYAFTVPVISGYLLWRQRDVVGAAAWRAAWWSGGLIISTSLVLLIVGRAADLQVVQQLAFLVSLVGVVLLVFGGDVVRAAWMPIAYLLLMIPVWDGLTEPLHEPFQLGSAAIGTGLLNLIGVAAYREDNFIALPNITLEVARACSGVNYLVAVVAVGLPVSFVYLTGVWRRALLLVFAVIVAALSNGLRIALIGVLAYLDIGSPLHGPAHLLHGLFVSAGGYLCLFGGVSLLTPRTSLRGDEAAGRNDAHAARVPWRPAIVAMLVFVVAGTSAWADGPAPVKLTASLALPSRLGPWTVDSAADDPVRPASWWPATDVSLARRYRHGDRIISVFVGYFERQLPDRELASFRNADLHRLAKSVTLTSDSGDFPANVVHSTDRRPFDAIFWYEVGGTAAVAPAQVKLLTARNHLLQGRSDGAVVLLLDEMPPDAVDGDGGMRALSDLAGRLRDALVGSFPRAGRQKLGAVVVPTRQRLRNNADRPMR